MNGFFIHSYFSEDQEEAAEFLQLQDQEANVEPCITEIIRNHRRIKLQTTEIHCQVTYVNISLQRISKQKLSLRVMVCTVRMLFNLVFVGRELRLNEILKVENHLSRT